MLHRQKGLTPEQEEMQTEIVEVCSGVFREAQCNCFKFVSNNKQTKLVFYRVYCYNSKPFEFYFRLIPFQ